MSKRYTPQFITAKPEDVIDRFNGSAAELGRALGITKTPAQAIYQWKRQGYVPSVYAAPLLLLGVIELDDLSMDSIDFQSPENQVVQTHENETRLSP